MATRGRDEDPGDAIKMDEAKTLMNQQFFQAVGCGSLSFHGEGG